MDDVKVDRGVRIPMRDGITLAVDLYRPVLADPVPTILEHIPYRKDDITGPGRDALYRALAARGFAIVRVDVRGTGASEGVAVDEYTQAEQEDGGEVVAWIAQQEWSSGAVGAWGMSYGGFSAIQLAGRRPPALKAIAAFYATDDRYTDDMHFYGGALCALELGHYPVRMIAMNALPPSSLDEGGQARWRERIQATPPWILSWLQEQHDGPYWRNGSLRPGYDRIECPVLIVGGWRDGYCNAAVRMAQKLAVPTRVVVGPWPHVLPDRSGLEPRIDVVGLLESWFGAHLRGDAEPSSVPPVRVFVQSFDRPDARLERVSGVWRGYPAWPTDTRLSLYLAPGGLLQAEPAGEVRDVRCDVVPRAGIQVGNWCPPPPPDGLPGDQRYDEVNAVTFHTAPLDEELVVLGNPRVRISVSHPGPTAMLAVKLSDVDETGASQLVTRGLLNLAHAATLGEPQPFAPDAPSAVEVELFATAWRFAPRHRIRLAVYSSDWPTVWPVPTTQPLRLRVGGPEATLDLPRAPQGAELPDESPPSPPGPDEGGRVQLPSVWRVVADGIAHRAGIETSWGAEHSLPEAGITARESLLVTAMTSETHPAAPVVEAEATFHLVRPDGDVRSEARATFSSSDSEFLAELSLAVHLNGREFATRDWSSRVPRRLV